MKLKIQWFRLTASQIHLEKELTSWKIDLKMLEMYFFLNNDEEPGQQNKAIKHTFNQHSRRQNIENEVEQQLKRVWQGIFQNE